MIAAAMTVLAVAAPGGWVEHVRTPSGRIDCEYGRLSSRYFIDCSADRSRDKDGCRTYYRLRDHGRARRVKNCGDPPMEAHEPRYGRWYYIYGGTLKVVGNRDVLRFRVDRRRGLRAANRSGHGYRVSVQRSRMW